MALNSASPQIANVKDGEKSCPRDLEEGEIEDGELPDEVSETGKKSSSKTKEEQSRGDGNQIGVMVEKSSKHEKVNDSPGSWLNRKKIHLNNERSNDPEEEWACVVEKKLKAAMNRDFVSENVNVTSSSVSPAKVYLEDDKKSKRKKRKKKHRDDDDEDDRKDSKKHRKNTIPWVGEEGQESSCKDKFRDTEESGDPAAAATAAADDDNNYYDDEMVFVRGASPIPRVSSNRDEGVPSKFIEEGFAFNQSGVYNETCDSYNEEESDFEGKEEFNRCNPPLSDDEAPKRTLGRGTKRRQRTIGRPVSHNKRQTRKDIKSKRSSVKRQHSSRSISEANVCMFYMQGKCQKGEDCPYSHNACPPRKMELCKFYLMDCCAKKDKCLYMHNDFPCKFFHTGLKCFSGARCKFSHSPLSDAMRNILLKGTEGNRHNEQRLSNRPSVPSQEHRSKHLETAPKELLGDFPRLSREGAAAMVYNKKSRSSKGKKIPSLFDIEVPIPAQLLADHKDGSKDQSPRRTPMPESDNEDQDGTTTPMPLSPVSDGKSKTKTRWGSDDLHVSQSRDSRDENSSRSRENICNDENKPVMPKFYKETDPELEILTVSKSRSNTDRDHRKTNVSSDSSNHADDKTEANSVEKSGVDERAMKKKDEKKSLNDSTNADSGTESNDAANIPLHLPKKQRELFLRIQQQQREAESSQDQGGEHGDENETIQEENWYSSDDEEDSITNVLKNLSKQGTSNTSQLVSHGNSAKESISANAPAISLPIKIPDLSKIKIDESFSKLISSICRKTPEESFKNLASSMVELSTPSLGVARDPRLARDPRSRSKVPASTDSASFSSQSVATTTPASHDGSKRTDPRRAHDPRSEKSNPKSESHSKVRGSSNSSGSNVNSRRTNSLSSSFTSIYSNAIMAEKTATRRAEQSLSLTGSSSGDIDLRNFLPRSLDSADVDLRSRNDTDLRTNQHPNALSFGDTDLRVGSHEIMNVGQVDRNRSSDVDLRRLDLPFKPVPMHTPATEIEASLTSHPPIPYKIVAVTIPRPDYTSLKLNTSDPQVQTDPRLRKIFKLQSPWPDISTKSSKENSAISVSRSDPRRHSTRVSSNSAVTSVTSGGHKSNSGTSVSSSGNSILINNENQGRSSDSFVGSSSSNLILKTACEKNNSSSLALQNVVMQTGVSSPASNPLLHNPTPRTGRDPRSAPSLLGPAPLPSNYCPSTPLFEEHSNLSSVVDNDLRALYDRGPVQDVRWEQHSQGNSLPVRNDWRSNRRNSQSLCTEDSRSYTPPI